MQVYIAILRGINVSGHKLIKMEALKKSLEKLLFTSIRTYIQSGNIVFSSKEKDIKKIEQNISKIILDDFNFEVPCKVVTKEKLIKVLNHNPFNKDNSKDPSFMHLTFLSDIPSNLDLSIFLERRLEGEEIVFYEDVVYLYCPKSYGNTKLSNSFIEQKLKLTATTRNLKTCHALVGLAELD